MAYLSFSEIGTAGDRALVEAVDTPAATRLTALEWSVVALARRQRLSSLRTPGRLAIALGALFGDTGNPRLADPRLEALRRMAVLSWHHGYTVPSYEVRAFIDAGFTPAQYELMVDSIGVERRRGSTAAPATPIAANA